MIIHIAHDNIMARIDEAILPPNIPTMLYEELKYRPEGYEHVYSFKSRSWDGWTRLFDIQDNSFRRGLLNRVIRLLEGHGYEVRTRYLTNQGEDVNHRFRQGILRPYDFQEGAIPTVLKEQVGILVSPTGTGKTAIIALILDAIKTPTMILVTDIVLLDQMQQSMQNYFDQPIGMIGDGEFQLENITVSTIQSLNSINKGKSIGAAEKRKALVKHVKHVGMVISDEAHLYDSEGVSEVMPLFTETPRFYGMSATPYGWAEKSEKKQNLELEQHFGEVIYDCRKLDFIDLGLKVPVIVNKMDRLPVNAEYKSHTKKSRYGGYEIDWTKNYRECLDTEMLKNPQYHADVAGFVWKLAVEGKSAFVHAAHSIEFGECICELIPGAVLVNGSTPRLKRREIYDAMRKKELLTIVSDVGGTGLDIPSLDAMVIASDLKDVRQLIGRVSRKPRSENKDIGLVVDVHTQTQFLSKHHSIRASQYSHEGYPIVNV